MLRGQKPLALCDRCPCFGSLFPPLAALTFAASSIICAFGLASAVPRSPYRHLELCGIALSKWQHIWHKSRCPALQHRFCAIFVSNTLRRNFQNTKRLHIQDMFYVQQFSFHFSHIFCHREYFLASCISSHCKLCTNAQKKCVFVHFLRCRICAFVFCDSFSIFTRFPL